jgi:hypothetical protein
MRGGGGDKNAAARQCRHTAAFLASHPKHHAGPGLACMCLPTNPALLCLRMHYNAGLVHAGCEAWDNSLDLFDACLVVPCSAAGPIAVAARKKGLLVWCLLLGGKELGGGFPPLCSQM